jgi:hypothetical protein
LYLCLFKISRHEDLGSIGRYEWLASRFDRFISEERPSVGHWKESWLDISDITLNILGEVLRKDSLPLSICLANFALFIHGSNLGHETDERNEGVNDASQSLWVNSGIRLKVYD